MSGTASPKNGAPAPTFFHGIEINGTNHKVWIVGRSFNHEAYYAVLPLLQDLERTQNGEMPAALTCLESLVVQYLLSPDAAKDERKFDLLLMPDRESKNERLLAAFDARLVERMEEMEVREVSVELRIWKKGWRIDQRRRDSIRQQEDDERRSAGNAYSDQGGETVGSDAGENRNDQAAAEQWQNGYV